MCGLTKREFVVESKYGRSFLVDYTAPADGEAVPAVLFVHGFKGFKDWGHFRLMAEKFARAGFAFFKFNMSHNGTTVANPGSFDDLEAFGNNNFTKELDDTETMITHIVESGFEKFSVDRRRLFLVGHSRGGGVAIIKAAEDSRVGGVATWAALNDFSMGASEEMIDAWKKNGVHYIDNVRTGQQMPLYFQLYENWKANRERLDPKKAMQKLRKPVLLIHGTDDETVPPAHLHELVAVNPAAAHHMVERGNHVFGGSHPHTGDRLHPHAEEVTEKTMAFFRTIEPR